MNITQTLLLVLAVVMMGVRLPSFMSRMGMSKKDKIVTVIVAFSSLGLTWFAMYVLDKFI